MYVCMYVCMCVCVSVCLCVCVSVCLCVYVSMYVCMYILLHWDLCSNSSLARIPAALAQLLVDLICQAAGPPVIALFVGVHQISGKEGLPSGPHWEKGSDQNGEEDMGKWEIIEITDEVEQTWANCRKLKENCENTMAIASPASLRTPGGGKGNGKTSTKSKTRTTVAAPSACFCNSHCGTLYLRSKSEHAQPWATVFSLSIVAPTNSLRHTITSQAPNWAWWRHGQPHGNHSTGAPFASHVPTICTGAVRTVSGDSAGALEHLPSQRLGGTRPAPRAGKTVCTRLLTTTKEKQTTKSLSALT